MSVDADSGPVGAEADSYVAESAGGGTAGGRGTPEGEPELSGHASRRSDLAAAVEHLSALVREGVLPAERTGAVGESQTGALCRRLCGAGTLSVGVAGEMD